MPNLTAATINLDNLKKGTEREIFDQGLHLFRTGLVSVDEIGKTHAVCSVFDVRKYRIEIKVSDKFLMFRCDCRYASRGLICQHDVAAAVGLQARLKKNQTPAWKTQLNQVIVAKPAARSRSPQPYLLYFSLQDDGPPGWSSWKLQPYLLPLKALPPELVQDGEPPDAQAMQHLLESRPDLMLQLKSPSKSLNVQGCINCSPEYAVLANLMIERNRTYSYYYYGSYPLDDYLSLVARIGSPLYLGDPGNPLKKALNVSLGAGELMVDITRQKDGLRLKARIKTDHGLVDPQKGRIEIISKNPNWILADRWLFRMDSQDEVMMPWLSEPELTIPADQESDFLEQFYLPLAKQVTLTGELVEWETAPETEMAPRLYLADAQGELHAQLRFGYGEHEATYDPKFPPEIVLNKADSWTLVQLPRKPAAEEAAYQALSTATYGLKRAPMAPNPGTFTLRARVHPVEFLLHYVPRLARDGFEVFGEEQLKTARVNRHMPSLSFNVSSGIDWFDVKTVVNFGDIEVSLKDLRRVVRKKERYIKLADGTIGEIPEEWLERYKHLFALGEESGDSMRLSHHHLTLIDQLLADSEQAQTDTEFERRRSRLRNFAGIQAKELPHGFTGDLRPYQKSGFDWLHFLNEFGFGGCLADDMGLGKTVQVLVFLQSLKETWQRDPQAAKPPASLVVVPRSLLVNWQREAARFTPGLNILEYFDQQRQKDPAIFDEYDLVITTYGIMLRDIEMLRQYTFHHVLLDESQAIKNPLSLTSKAARLLRARRRLVLTGTPVENSTVELWSQFAFLNPGLLGSLDYFKDNFGTPIQKKGDEQAAQFLRQMVYPFILRRTKDQVAPELPPRSERVLYSDMEPAQRKLYNRTRDYYRGILMGMIEKEGMSGVRMKILEGLLRLRQICNHPRLVDEKFRGDSAKFELLMETLDTLRAEGHKVLVFSQFVQMLRLVRQSLDNRQIPYMYLDGKTKDRQERVDAFQTDPNFPFFLISLKAGGVGLNLTAADYVIHIDPWWNPAVEMQASDRTHRIGQDKPVFVYKLIARDSVEEKVLQLQEQKKHLVDQLITTEGGIFKSLTPEDVQVLFSVGG